MRLNFFDRINPKILKRIYKVLKIIVFAYAVLFCIAFLIFCGIRAHYPIKYKEYVFAYADEYQLDSHLIFSVIKVESSFNEKAVSSAGAKGLMQITDRTGAYIAEKLGVTDYDLLDAKTSVAFGSFYLRYLYDKFENLEVVLAAYNAGEGKVALWLENKEYSADGVTLSRVPYAETEAYIEKIKKTFSKYKKLYENILDKRQNFE